MSARPPKKRHSRRRTSWVNKLVDIGSMDGPSFKYLQLLAVASLLGVWSVELATNTIAWWDRWVYPLITVILSTGALVAIYAPRHIASVRLVTVITINLFMVTEIQMIVHHTSPMDMYQIAGTLQWLPLAFGLSYLFLNNRAAIGITLCVLVYEIATFSYKILASDVRFELGENLQALLWTSLIAQVMYACLFVAIVYIKLNARTAQTQAQAMSKKALTDPLTKVVNRRGLDYALERATLDRHANGRAALFILDVDHFKRVNDTYGHPAGDRVLTEIASLLSTQIRNRDTLGRWGGEEFMVIAPGLPPNAALELGERLRTTIEQATFPKAGSLTISIGVSELEVGTPTQTAVDAADHALYRAKNLGRNRVEYGSPH